MFYLIIVLFVLGYIAVAFEHQLSIDKASVALIIGVLIWVCIAFVHDTSVAQYELFEHLGSISGILFFLIGAMTIVEIIDSHGGFSMLSKVIKTTDKVKLLWIIASITFFMSSLLDNLTTTIVMINLMWKLVGGKNTRWYFAGIIVIAANAGGAWSPIGDVSTIMLWIGGHLSALNIVKQLFVPAFLCLLVPLVIISLDMKGVTVHPSRSERLRSSVTTTDRERWIILVSGTCSLIFVPIFKAITGLPPYMGMMLMLGIMWVMTEILHRKKQKELKMRLTLSGILKKIDTPTILFLFGILLAVAGLESAGHLGMFGSFLEEKVHNIYAITMAIGTLSSTVDNSALVAGTMGMYEIVTPEALSAITDPAKLAYMKYFAFDGSFWELLAYCAGTGGSILIIGSAAGVAAMGLTKIEFMWYLKKFSLLVILGYLSGFLAYFLIAG